MEILWVLLKVSAVWTALYRFLWRGEVTAAQLLHTQYNIQHTVAAIVSD